MDQQGFGIQQSENDLNNEDTVNQREAYKVRAANTVNDITDNKSTDTVENLNLRIKEMSEVLSTRESELAAVREELTEVRLELAEKDQVLAFAEQKIKQESLKITKMHGNILAIAKKCDQLAKKCDQLLKK